MVPAQPRRDVIGIISRQLVDTAAIGVPEARHKVYQRFRDRLEILIAQGSAKADARAVLEATIDQLEQDLGRQQPACTGVVSLPEAGHPANPQGSLKTFDSDARGNSETPGSSTGTNLVDSKDDGSEAAGKKMLDVVMHRIQALGPNPNFAMRQEVYRLLKGRVMAGISEGKLREWSERVLKDAIEQVERTYFVPAEISDHRIAGDHQTVSSRGGNRTDAPVPAAQLRAARYNRVKIVFGVLPLLVGLLAASMIYGWVLRPSPELVEGRAYPLPSSK